MASKKIPPAPKVVSMRSTDEPVAAIPPEHMDGWTSFLTGLGTTRDKRESAFHVTTQTIRAEQENLWRGNDLAARGVEDRPREMLRKGFEIKVAPEPDADPKARADAFPPSPITGGRVAIPGSQNGAGVPPMAGIPAHAMTPPTLPGALGMPGPKPIPAQDDSARILAEAAMQAWRDLDGYGAFTTAMEYERAYGGAAIVLGVDDGADDLREPLNLDAVESLDWMNVLTPRETYTVAYYTSPREAKYGKPAIYRIMPEMLAGPAATSGNWNGTSAMNVPALQIFEIHESRLIVFPGIVTSNIMRRRQAGWGDSIFNRAEKVLRDFGVSWDAAACILADFGQAVYKIKGLAELLARKGGEQKLIDRILMMDKSRSVIRAMAIDADGEEFTRQQSPVTGLPELLDKFCLRLAAAFSMPVTRLMGQSPAGLNATGDADIRGYYDSIAGDQEHRLLPHLKRWFQILLRSKKGPSKGVEPSNWSLKFASLWQLDELQESTRRWNIAQADVACVNAGILTPEEVAASRFGGDEYNPETTIDAATRQAMADAHEEAAEQVAKQAEDDAARINSTIGGQGGGGGGGGGGDTVAPLAAPTPSNVSPTAQPIQPPRASDGNQDRNDAGSQGIATHSVATYNAESQGQFHERAASTAARGSAEESGHFSAAADAFHEAAYHASAQAAEHQRIGNDKKAGELRTQASKYSQRARKNYSKSGASTKASGGGGGDEEARDEHGKWTK